MSVSSINIAPRPLALVLWTVLATSTLSAQTERVIRMPYADHRPSYIGLQVGTHLGGINLLNTGAKSASNEVLYAEQAGYRMGLSIGIVGGLVLQPGWDLRAMPTLHIGDKIIRYSDGVEEVERLRLSSTSLTLPLQLKWAATREYNIRPYLALGPYLGLNLSGRAGDVLRSQPLELGLHTSLGCDLYLGQVKLSPELSYSYSFGQAIRLNRPELAGDPRLRYTEALRSSHKHQITLSLHFQ